MKTPAPLASILLLGGGLLLGCAPSDSDPEEPTLEQWMTGTWRSEYYSETTIVEADISFHEWTFESDGSLRMRAGEWSAEFGVGYHGPNERNYDPDEWSVIESEITLHAEGEPERTLPMRVVNDDGPTTDEFEAFVELDRESPSTEWLSFMRAEARPLPEQG